MGILSIYFKQKNNLKKTVGKIVTDSTALEDPKDWSTCNVYALAKLFLDKDGLLELQQRYEKGGEGYGHFKMYLKELIWDYFKEAREKREHYLNNTQEVYDILDAGAAKASTIAKKKMQIIRDAVGIYR